MKIGILKERVPGERRVSLVPASVPRLVAKQLEVLVEAGAGHEAGFSDEQYASRGARVVQSRQQLIDEADVAVQVRPTSAAPEVEGLFWRRGLIVVGLCDPLGNPEQVVALATKGLTVFGLELMPRTTRAQAMDVLSSQATVAGYRAVLLAAIESPKMFPLMMTAAGTIAAAKVFVIGAGVAGLQAIATARRLGAVVQAYDVRPACREQVESLGARFIELPLETGQAEDQGGYAKAMGEEFYQRQGQLMSDTVAASDIVITTALVPGKRSPLLITAEAVRRMSPGSVIVDLAAERGGNCELTRADQRIVENGVVILGPTNLPAEVPRDASIMLSNNITHFLLHLIRDGKASVESSDEIIRETLVARDGEIVHPRVRQLLDEAVSQS